MGKGKKFDAAERHFAKKKDQYESRLTYWRAEVKKLESQNRELTNQIKEQEYMLTSKEEWIERLLEFTEMSKDELIAIIADHRPQIHMVTTGARGNTIFEDQIRNSKLFQKETPHVDGVDALVYAMFGFKI